MTDTGVRVCMKSACAQLVIVCLVTSLLPACAAKRGPRRVEELFGKAVSPESDWSRVSQIVPGVVIFLTINGARPVSRRFVAATNSGLVTLNADGTALPAAAQRVLRDMATTHPEYLEAALGTGRFQQQNVRVEPDGVFVADRKVAELNQVVETVSRANVRQISGPVVARGSVLGVMLGGYVGFCVGVVPGLGGVAAAGAVMALIGSTVVGGYLGFRWTSHETEGLVYQAPPPPPSRR